MTKMPPTRSPRPSEEGYILVAVIFMLAILIITMAVAAPKVAKEIQRDRELETMQRGKQYMRAVRMYYKKFNAYPPSVDVLLKAPGAVSLRFLRKKYVDPTTGKDEWKPIHFGQNKAPTAMGFFGQPLTGTSVAGVGAGGVAGASAPGSSFMSSSGSIGGSTTPAGTTPGATDPTGATASGTAASGTSGTDPNASSSTLGGSTGQTFGGLGIIGFSPHSPKESILTYKKKNHYNEWEFVYDPLSEQMLMGGSSAPSGAVPAANMQNGGNGNNSTFGGNNSTFGGGNSSLGGSTNSGTSGTNSGSGTTAPQE